MRSLQLLLWSFFCFVLIIGLGCSSSLPKLESEPELMIDPPGPAPEGMVWIPGGEFEMGTHNPHFPDAHPVHQVKVDGFWMDKTEVTNEEFERFVRVTGYVTYAERTPLQEHFKEHVSAIKLVPGSAVFTPEKAGSLGPKDKFKGPPPWWSYVHGASWKHPQGPNSDIKGKEKHPVCHINWEDANTYAKWAGKRLPTEAEWERAARGGKSYKEFFWGDELTPGGKWMANIFQGTFPHTNTKLDGYERTAPVGSFPPNPYGLYDMVGNVWEWCLDNYLADYYEFSPLRNPMGPIISQDPTGMGEFRKSQRGGSFYCCDQYCNRYRAGARRDSEPLSSAEHLGFRCVKIPIR